MSFKARASASSRRLVNHFSGGTSITITKATGTFNPADGDMSSGSSSFTVACTNPSPFGQRLVDGARILAGDLRVLIRAADSAITFEIEPDQMASLGGKVYRVAGVNPHVASIELQLRGPA